MLNSELNILAIYGLLVCLTLVAQASGAMTQLDMGYLLSSRDSHRTLTGMVARLERALNNSVVGMALFAPAILILQAKSGFNATTLIAAQVFLLARVLYLPAYVFNLVGFRTLVWLVGFAMTTLLYALCL